MKTCRRDKYFMAPSLTALAIVISYGAAGAARAQSAAASTTAPAAAGGNVAQSPTPSLAGGTATQPAASSAATSGADTKVANPEAIVPEVVVTGARSQAGGLMKTQRAPEAISSVTAEAIAQRTPLATPLQLISTIPGANFGTSDPYGLTIRNFLALRGLDQTEIGWVVEGVPAIDPQNFAPFIETFADTENISDITVIAGNSRLQDPVLNATGGEYIQSVRDPSSQFGGLVSGTVGSFDGRRGFGRIDTGEIGQTGITAFLSGSMSAANAEQGPGTNTREHIDFKARGDWGRSASSTLFISLNSLSNARVPIPTLAQFNTAKATGNLQPIEYLSTYPSTGSTNYYENYIWKRDNAFVSNINKIQLTNDATLTVTPYFHYTHILSPGGTSVSPTSVYDGNTLITPVVDPSTEIGGKIFAENIQYLTEYQYGLNAILEYNFTPSNHFMAGYWRDDFTLNSVAYVEPLNASGEPIGTGESTALQSASKQLVTGTDYSDGTVIDQFFVGDTQGFLNDRAQLSVGGKYLDYEASGYNYLPGPQNSFKAHIGQFLPRASFSFDATSDIQLYGNIIKSLRTPLTTATYINTYNISSGALAQIANPNAQPETSLGEEVGLRYNGLVHLDVNYFHNNLSNVQIISLTPVNGTNTTVVLSAGGVTINGVEAEISTRHYAGFSLYANTQYLDAVLDNNIPYDGDFLPSKGKIKPLSPKWTNNLVLAYDNRWLFSKLSYKYTSSQYSTFVNDQEMPAFSTLDFSIGAHLPAYSVAKAPTISLNFINLTAGRYLSTVAGIKSNANPVVGINGTTIPGSAPSYYVAAPFAVTATLSTTF